MTSLVSPNLESQEQSPAAVAEKGNLPAEEGAAAAAAAAAAVAPASALLEVSGGGGLASQSLPELGDQLLPAGKSEAGDSSDAIIETTLLVGSEDGESKEPKWHDDPLQRMREEKVFREVSLRHQH